MSLLAWLRRKLAPGCSLVLATVLMLGLGLGLSTCSKKPRPDAKQADEAVPADTPTMNAMDAMNNNDPSLRLRTMERPDPHPDGGVANPKGNKGMIGQMKLVDPNE